MKGNDIAQRLLSWGVGVRRLMGKFSKDTRDLRTEPTSPFPAPGSRFTSSPPRPVQSGVCTQYSLWGWWCGSTRATKVGTVHRCLGNERECHRVAGGPSGAKLQRPPVRVTASPGTTVLGIQHVGVDGRVCLPCRHRRGRSRVIRP
jgi:hypothetical protein